MPKWKHHVFVCQNRRPPGHPKGSCAERGSEDLLMAFGEQVERLELWETVKVTGSACLGPCRQGAIVVVYPEGVWYAGVKASDVGEIVRSHFVEGQPVQRLVMTDP